MAIAPESKLLAYYVRIEDQNQVKLWDSELNKQRAGFSSERAKLFDMEFTSDGKWLIATNFWSPMNPKWSIALFSVATGKVQGQLIPPGSQDFCTSFALFPGDKALVGVG